MIEILKNINPLMILVFITFFVGIIFLDFKNPIHKLLLSILLICFTTEILSIYNLVIKHNINFLYSISLIFYFSLWLLLIENVNNFRSEGTVLVIIFIAFGLINLFYFEGLKSFNFSTFLFGSLLYILVLISSSIYNLMNDKLNFFKSNNFLLIFSPVLFMFGLSFMFGFHSIDLTDTYVCNKLKLYTFITYLVNLVNYSLINIYIYRERKLQNA